MTMAAVPSLKKHKPKRKIAELDEGAAKVQFIQASRELYSPVVFRDVELKEYLRSGPSDSEKTMHFDLCRTRSLLSRTPSMG
jgi:hypothetical protein